MSTVKKRTSLNPQKIIIGILLAIPIVIVLYLSIGVFQVGREATIRTKIMNELQQINPSAIYTSSVSDTLDCSYGTGIFGSPRGYVCIGGISKDFGFKETDKNQVYDQVNALLIAHGWLQNDTGATYKTVGRDELTILVDCVAKGEFEKVDFSDLSYGGRQSFQRVIDKNREFFAINPQMQTYVSVYMSDIPR